LILRRQCIKIISIGRIEINYVDRKGNYIVVQNTSASGKGDIDLTGWSLSKTIDSHNKLVYEFPNHFILKGRSPVRIFARNASKGLSCVPQHEGETVLFADYVVTWGMGKNMVTQLIDDEGNEQAVYIQKFT
jgi:hypothetical protein